MEYVINGLFLTQRITGIQRYALGITKELDKIVGDKHIKIIVPQSYSGGKIKLENIDVVRYGKRSGIVWEQTDFHRYLLKNKVKSINFCNVCPIGVYPGITVIYDLMFKKFLRDKSNVRIKLSHICLSSSIAACLSKINLTFKRGWEIYSLKSLAPIGVLV